MKPRMCVRRFVWNTGLASALDITAHGRRDPPDPVPAGHQRPSPEKQRPGCRAGPGPSIPASHPWPVPCRQRGRPTRSESASKPRDVLPGTMEKEQQPGRRQVHSAVFPVSLLAVGCTASYASPCGPALAPPRPSRDPAGGLRPYRVSVPQGPGFRPDLQARLSSPLSLSCHLWTRPSPSILLPPPLTALVSQVQSPPFRDPHRVCPFSGSALRPSERFMPFLGA